MIRPILLLFSAALCASAAPVLFFSKSFPGSVPAYMQVTLDQAGNADPTPATATWTSDQSGSTTPAPAITSKPTGLSCSMAIARKLSARKLRSGVTVTYRCSKPARAALTLKLAGKKIAAGKTSGLSFTLRARKLRATQGKLTLTVVFSSPGASSAQVIAKARLVA